VGARIARAVAGAHKSIIGGSLTSGVDGDVKSDTGGKLVVDVDGDTVITAGKEDKLEIGGSDAEHVEAILSVGGKTVQMKAEKLTFSVDGKLLLDMAQSGALKLNASTLTIESSGEIKTKGSKIDKTSSGSAPSASVSPPKPDTLDPATVRRAKLVSVQMSSPDGAPVAGLVFEARLPDGTVKRGRLSGDGSAALPAPDSGDVQITFPDLDAAEWDVE
jgi:hypothetical protein